MQERRTTVRVDYAAPAQYCTAKDLLPQGGRLTNLSERGARVDLREPPAHGDQVTVSFLLPGDHEAVTATGVVRWADQGPRWCQAGLEWLPLEDGTRHRLHRFLALRYADVTGAHRAPAWWAALPGRWTGRRPWVLAGGMTVVVLGFLWALSIAQENRKLAAMLSQREAVIQQLEQHRAILRQDRARLRQELEVTAGRLAQATDEMMRLDQQVQALQASMTQLGQAVEQFQESSTQIRTERAELMQRVLDLELERTALAKRLSSIEELRLAIREAIASRRQAQEAKRLRLFTTRREADTQWLSTGNRGYVIRAGLSTLGRPASVSIRVHEPESLSP